MWQNRALPGGISGLLAAPSLTVPTLGARGLPPGFASGRTGHLQGRISCLLTVPPLPTLCA